MSDPATPRESPAAPAPDDGSHPDGWRQLALGMVYLALVACLGWMIMVMFPPSEPHRPRVPPSAVGKVVLTVNHPGGQATFDMRTLQALPQVTLKVLTPWYARPVTFQGPRLRDVLAAAGARGTQIEAVAVNDYSAMIPFDDVDSYDVIVAVRMNGRRLSPRDRGPLFVVYPYDKLPEDQVVPAQDRSVWQLDVLNVR